MRRDATQGVLLDARSLINERASDGDQGGDDDDDR